MKEEKTKVEQVFEFTEKTAVPTLLKFQNGSLAVVTKENLQFCLMENLKKTTTANKSALVIAGGQAYCGEIEEDPLTDTYICVRNKSTNKVRILPMQTANLKNSIFKEKEAESVKQQDVDRKLLTKKLLQEFGGRKASRLVADQEKMKISMDIIKDDLDATVKETTLTDPGKDEKTKSHMELIAPKHNKGAERLEDVYDLNDVIPAELMSRLNEEAKAVFSTSIEHIPISSNYLLDLLRDIKSTKVASEEDFQKIKIIIFMDCLYNLMKTNENILSKAEISRITTKVENDVRKRFGGPTGRRNKVGVEKALCYYIALALLLSKEYEIDADILAKDLDKSLPIVTKFAQLANALLIPKTTKLKLRLPKNVPELVQKGRRRRTQ